MEQPSTRSLGKPYVRTTKGNAELSFRGVDYSDIILGGARFIAKQGWMELRGLQIPCTIRESAATYFPHEVCFYGRVSDLLPNFLTRSGTALSLPRLDSFKDRPIPQGSQSVRRLENRFGIENRDMKYYYQIPLDSLNLDKPRKEFLDAILERMPEFLGKLVDTMETVVLDKDNLTLSKQVNSHFRNFPGSLASQALEQGKFYTSRIEKASVNRTEVVYLPKVTILSTPMGGLPDWARDLWRSR